MSGAGRVKREHSMTIKRELPKAADSDDNEDVTVVDERSAKRRFPAFGARRGRCAGLSRSGHVYGSCVQYRAVEVVGQSRRAVCIAASSNICLR